VLGTPPLLVNNGLTRIVYKSGSMYEGEVKDGKRCGLCSCITHVCVRVLFALYCMHLHSSLMHLQRCFFVRSTDLVQLLARFRDELSMLTYTDVAMRLYVCMYVYM
jgi:hypothetical protein